MIGKGSRHLDLGVAKRSNLLSIDSDGADELILLEHRHREICARSGTNGLYGGGTPGAWIVVQLGLATRLAGQLVNKVVLLGAAST